MIYQQVLDAKEPSKVSNFCGRADGMERAEDMTIGGRCGKQHWLSLIGEFLAMLVIYPFDSVGCLIGQSVGLSFELA